MEYYNRKRTRLKDYDYSQPGMYFITMCTLEKEKILSRIECDVVGDGVPYKFDGCTVCIIFEKVYK